MVLVTNSAVEQYVSPLVDFDIVLFRASLASLMFLAAGPKLGWDTVTHGTIKVINKKCDHLTMLEDPIATQIGQEISEIYAVRA
jgi:thioesterase domain-containing protein